MSLEEQNPTTITATALVPAESEMVQRKRWDEIRRLYYQELCAASSAKKSG